MFVVTATDLPRLIACNGSRLMGGQKPPIQADDSVRQEGIAAHWLAQQVKNGFTALELVDRKAPNGVYITADMIDYLEEYLKDIHFCDLEIDTSYATDQWKVNGRADKIYYDSETSTLYIGELKYGWGIIEPENNWTLISHAYSYLQKNNLPAKRIVLTIFQPRPSHPLGRVRSCVMSFVEFHDKINHLYNVLNNPSDELVTCPQCYKCPALATCPAARKACLNAIDASEMAYVDDIDNKQLSFDLDLYTRAINILEQRLGAYKELAHHRLKTGEIIDNYALDRELSNRTWQEHVTSALITSVTGKDVTKKTLMTPSQVEKLGVDKEIVDAFTERHNKGVKLVRMDANARAKKMFKQTERK